MFGRKLFWTIRLKWFKRSKSPTKIVYEQFKSTEIRKICTGTSFSTVLSKNGWVFSWGSNAVGQLGIGYENGEKHIKVPLDKLLLKIKIVAIDSSHNHTLAVTVNVAQFSCSSTSRCIYIITAFRKLFLISP